MRMTEEARVQALEQIPVPPPDAVFKLDKVVNVTMPHPYCITSKHVVVASDHHGGMLDEYAIKDAEKRGAKCGVKGCRLKYSEHETNATLVVIVPNNKNLNAVQGLHAYLVSIKDVATKLGIDGFAFPTKPWVE